MLVNFVYRCKLIEHKNCANKGESINTLLEIENDVRLSQDVSKFFQLNLLEWENKLTYRIYQIKISPRLRVSLSTLG